MTENELKELPSFMAEDGSRKYIQEVDGDVYTLDEYGRVTREDGFGGDVYFSFYDDDKQIVTTIDIWAENYSFHKHIYEMCPAERIENCLKILRGEDINPDNDPDFYTRKLLLNETEQIQAQIEEVRKRYPGEYLEPEEYFSELGIH